MHGVRIAHEVYRYGERDSTGGRMKPWSVRWAAGSVDADTASEALRSAADLAPGGYRDALLAAAADPPPTPGEGVSSATAR